MESTGEGKSVWSTGEGKSVWRVLERVGQCGESWRG